MPRCSPERMFPSSQWWRCRCYIDTFLLWDSPREFPTSSTAYHSNLYIAPSEVFSVTWHHPQWRRKLREVSQNDLTISEHRSSGFVNYSLLDCRWPSSRCHMPSAVRPVQIQPFQVGRLIVLTCDCLELWHLTDASCEKIRVRCRELIHLSITIGEDFLNGLVLFQPGKVGIPEDNIDAML